jgi:hypothetical protein
MVTWSNEKSKQAQHKSTDNRGPSKPPYGEARKETVPDLPWRTDTGIEVEEISYEEFVRQTGYKPE